MITSISLGLRVIPPSAGLSRAVRKPPQVIGHHIKQNKVRYQLSVNPDKELEAEIKKYRDVV